ncbi:hypothetical protein ACP4OV_014614 [Aristida adscensionis]
MDGHVMLCCRKPHYSSINRAPIFAPERRTTHNPSVSPPKVPFMDLESEVQVLESSFVVPSEATPRKELCLSPLDIAAVRRDTPVVFFYHADDAAAADFFDVARLKEAMAKTLVPFYPLAGRFDVDGDGRVVVSCNDEGVLFVVARSSLTAHHFDDFKPSQEQRRLFIPHVEPSSVIMAVQQRVQAHQNETVVDMELETVATRVSNANEAVETEEIGASNDPDVVLNDGDIISDPGLRIPIDQIHPNIRDAAKRAYILKGPCQPKGHNYPKRKICNRNRSFHDEWYKNHPWLEYSVAKDAAFCFYCFLFKQPRAENYGIDAFTVIGFRGWKDGRELLDAHGNGIDHNKARKHYEDFKNQRQSVSHAMHRGGKKSKEEYKGRLIVVLGVIRFLLLQALAFRGHDESCDSDNKGNFLEMVQWYKEKDKNVANLLRTNQMTSPEIQKDICKACANQTTKAIITDIGDRNFAILIDEARDASIKEQMAIVVRYINARGHVIERFLGLKEVPDTTSACLKEALDGMLAEHGLSISRVRGQGYDGASNMRGEFHGLQRRILDENPYAFYIHCFAHQLQLVVVSVAKCCTPVFEFFGTSTLIVNTINASCKRRDQLAQAHHEHLVKQLDNAEIFSGRGRNQETNLARPGDTRWGSHHKTLCRILLMWDAILEVLENLAEDGSGDKKYVASGLIRQMENFEFVFVLHLMIRLLGKTNDLSQCLQRKGQNIIRAVGLIGAMLQTINDIRENGWEELFEEVTTFCLKRNIPITDMAAKVTVRGRSRGRGGQLVTYYHYFKNEIFNMVYDQIIMEFNNRFGERSTQLLRCIACLDPNNSFANYDKEKILELASIYEHDFSGYEILALREQIPIFINDVRTDPKFKNCHDLGDLAITVVQTGMANDFRFVYRLVELALILPVATATVERAFSAMKIIKTELRNKMGNEWLNHRMICYIEREIFKTIKDEDILYHFQEMRSRLKKLPPLPRSRITEIGSSSVPAVDGPGC